MLLSRVDRTGDDLWTIVGTRLPACGQIGAPWGRSPDRARTCATLWTALGRPHPV